MNWTLMDNMLRKPSLRALWMSLLLSGCAVGPNFHHPHVPKIHRYTEKELPAATVSTPTIGGNKQVFHLGKKIPKQWWTVFHSRALNKLIEESIHANPDMKAAAAALKVAHAQTMIQRTAFLPALKVIITQCVN